jgi:catechol 2,3-dioxygenase-like lactoylglutathione lyase family enzyme
VLADAEIVAFAAATDLDRARGFYADVLGLELVEQTEFACVFEANGTTLRVNRVEEVPTPGYTVLGWYVGDITDTARQLTERGVTFLRPDGIEQDEHGVWTAPGGARVAWFPDPDGNVLSLTEFF